MDSRTSKCERWDLVVSNLPHFKGSAEERSKDIDGLVRIDPCWGIHEQFYKDISHFLSLAGSVLFVENANGSNLALWRKMIESSGLQFVGSFSAKISLLRYIRAVGPRPLFGLDMLLFGRRFERQFLTQSGFRSYPYYFVWSKQK